MFQSLSHPPPPIALIADSVPKLIALSQSCNAGIERGAIDRPALTTVQLVERCLLLRQCLFRLLPPPPPPPPTTTTTTTTSSPFPYFAYLCAEPFDGCLTRPWLGSWPSCCCAWCPSSPTSTSASSTRPVRPRPASLCIIVEFRISYPARAVLAPPREPGPVIPANARPLRHLARVLAAGAGRPKRDCAMRGSVLYLVSRNNAARTADGEADPRWPRPASCRVKTGGACRLCF